MVMKRNILCATRDFLSMNSEVTQGLFGLMMGVNPSNNADCGTECPVEMVSGMMLQPLQMHSVSKMDIFMLFL